MRLEQQCIDVLTKHLGPAAPSFLARQCKSHLNIESSMLQVSHLNDLGKWCYIGVSLAVNKEVAQTVRQDILALK